MFSAKLKTEHATLEEREARVRAVSNFILSHEAVGPIESHSSWLAGQQNVRAGFLGPDKEIVAFLGSVATCFMLAGSSGHIVGMRPDDPSSHFGFSFLPRIIDRIELSTKILDEGLSISGICKGIKVAKRMLSSKESNKLLTPEGLRQEHFRTLDEHLSSMVGGLIFSSRMEQIILNAWQNFGGPITSIEFIAKKLTVIENRNSAIEYSLLATPLFIAEAD